MSSSNRSNLYLPLIIGFDKKTLDEIIKNIDNYYEEWEEIKYDKNGDEKKYKDGTIKKRTIRPSKQPLKLIQQRIKNRILNNIELPQNIHGGIKKKSNITNAKPHQGNKYKFTTDLKDFYPSIKSKKVYETFLDLGFNKQTSYYLTRLTTWKGELPQGTPTSTHISNIIFLKTDLLLIELCNRNNLTYTRYIDDLSFSSQKDFRDKIDEIMLILKSSKLSISHRKTSYNGKQIITGIEVFNHKIDAPKKIILKAEEEIKENKKLKPFNNYLNSIRKTNRKNI